MSQTRETIIKELSGNPYYMNDRECELLADFVLADRRRVVEPLVDLQLCSGGDSYEHLCQRIEQTLKNAGVEL